MRDRAKLIGVITAFMFFYLLPASASGFEKGITEAAWMLRDYARERILFCLLPAFFIAGAISVFISRASMWKHLGAGAGAFAAYFTAVISATLLTACPNTVLPLFAAIYMRGARLGPAMAFLYSGPTLNGLAIILTVLVLGLQLGAARLIVAILLTVLIGPLMRLIFHQEESQRLANLPVDVEETVIPASKVIIHVGSMMLFLIFANWEDPTLPSKLKQMVYSAKWYAAGVSLFVTILASIFLLTDAQRRAWLRSTWKHICMMTPLILAGVFAAGFLIGRPGHEALISSEWIYSLTVGNSLAANFLAALFGALMYIDTSTEISILREFIGAGMGQGPALAFMLADSALSLPLILVVQRVLGWKKTLTYAAIVICASAAAGILYVMLP